MCFRNSLKLNIKSPSEGRVQCFIDAVLGSFKHKRPEALYEEVKTLNLSAFYVKHVQLSTR